MSSSDRLAYQKTIPWKHWYSNVKLTCDADGTITRRVWCTYFDASDAQIGRFDCEPTQCAGQGKMQPGEESVVEKAYRFTDE
jgi:hypothetical protein